MKEREFEPATLVTFDEFAERDDTKDEILLEQIPDLEDLASSTSALIR